MTGKVKIVSAFIVSIALLIVIGFYAYRKTQDYKRASDWVNHTQEVIRETQTILLLVEDIETSQRGYVITGNIKYLEPYEKSRITIKAACHKIAELTRDNPRQQKLLDSICSEIGSKVLFAQNVIAIREKDGFEASQKLISSDRGEMLMKKIRLSVEDFINHEEGLLSTRIADSNQNFTSTLKIIFLCVILAAIIVFITLYFFIKDHQKRLAIEQKLLESEQRIKNFFDVLPIGVFIVDHKGKPFYANSRSQEILGKGIVGDSDSSSLPEVYSAYIAGTQTIYPAEKQPIVRALMGVKNVSLEDM
ncbi:MAG: CHASE3 domain-containing protein, partial [Bacteroidota bacterium]